MSERFRDNTTNGRAAEGRLPRRLLAGAMCAALLTAGAAWAQVLTIDTSGRAHETANGPVDRRYQQVTPTHVDLSTQELDSRTRLMLIRALQSEQGFAMRPLPRGHKGLTLEANGKLNPAGEAYLDMTTANGISAVPGARVVITNVNIDRDKIVLDLNGGPDPKHRFLRHVQIGMGGPYDDPTMDQPVAGNPNDVPTGARVTLAFKGHVPEMTATEAEALLAPLISFNVETPIEAYTNTLPAQLKKAILDHEVWVGMSDTMVLFAKGDPVNKYREMDGQMPITIWMYGKAPDTVTFVRFNGNRVIRVEIARMGMPLEVFTKDVVTPLMMENGTPMETASSEHPIQEGDVQRNPETQAPAAPPTLRAPGEKMPPGSSQTQGTMGPVYFPPDTQDNGTQLGQNPDVQPSAAAPAGSSPNAQAKQGSGTQQPAAPAGSQSAPANATEQQTAPKPPAEEQLVAAGRAE